MNIVEKGKVCYNVNVVPPIPGNGGGVWMEVILSFLVAVMAGVVSHHINKWLDSKDTEDNK